MRLSEGVEWGIHCATLLALAPTPLTMSSARLAEYHDVPAPYLTKHLQALVRAGVLESVPGPKGGYRLARPGTEVTLLDVVEAIDGTQPSFVCTEIRRRAPMRMPESDFTLPCAIHAAMDRADAAWREELRAVTVAELAQHVMTTVSPPSLEQGARWLQQAVR
jgi:Rrf2 family protein